MEDQSDTFVPDSTLIYEDELKSNNRTIEQSNNRTIEQSNNRTIEQSNNIFRYDIHLSKT